MYANITMGEPNNLLPASLTLLLYCFAFASDGQNGAFRLPLGCQRPIKFVVEVF